MFEQTAFPSSASSFRLEYRLRAPGYRTPSPPRQAVEPLSPQGAPFNPDMNMANDTVPKKRSYDHYQPQNTRPESHWQGQDPKSFGTRGQRSSFPGPAPIDTRATAHAQPSALDIFATIATSPSLAARDQFASFHYPSPATAFTADPLSKTQPFERASKRSRSEVINHRPVLGYDSRPTTSHVYPSPFSPTSPQSGHMNGFGDKPYNQHSVKPLSQANIHCQDDAVSLRQDAELLLSISRGFPDRSQPKPHMNGSVMHHDQSLNGSFIRPDFNDSSRANFTGGNRHRPFSRSVDMTDLSGGLKPEGHVLYQDTGIPPKPKDHRGWPKGKPRGPRNTGTESKKRTKTTKRADTNGERASNKSRSRLNDTSGPSSVQVNASSYNMPNLDVPEEVRRPRRASDTKINRFDRELASQDNTSRKRRSSAPPKTSTPTSQSGGKKSRARREPQLDICAACKRNRNSAEGVHELWINCNGCKSWFHTTCAGFFEERKVKDVDKYYCGECECKYGPTTFVRKSSRAHASVDYAGLNEGKIRTADDIPDHHYIEPIKNGALEFLPETFARLPPELITKDFFEKCGEWTEPIVIPAALNTKPRRETSENGLKQSEHLPEPKEALEPNAFSEQYEYDCVPDEGQDSLDMVIPEDLTVRQVAELYGPEEKVDVIDVKLQEGEDKRWNMRQWADYYEAEGDKPVRNVISLEVSQSLLGKLIRRPKIVRDLDLQDSVWPEEETAKGVFPRVQFYCLMSVADCYTDFHIDFGGSSVYYHILKGRKTFFFIPPKPKFLKKYEEWCNSPDQNSTFLGNETKECYRVDLYPGDTMLIPSGWIHAVWTPENSLVIGGNFLTKMHYSMQITVNEIEKATNVTRKFRYPHFQKILWLAVVRYLQQDPIPSTVVDLLCQGHQFERSKPIHLEHDEEEFALDDYEHFNARYYSQGEIDGLTELLRYVHRTVIISLGKMPGVTRKTQDAVQRSMPKECSDHVQALRTFAMWVAWKRGNENIPAWAYPDAPIEDTNVTDKKPSAAAQRKAERVAMQEALEAAGTRRTSTRTPSKPTVEAMSPSSSFKLVGEDSTKTARPAEGRRIACEACRKRRRRCTHNGNEEIASDEAAPAALHPPVPPAQFGVRIIRLPKVDQPKENASPIVPSFSSCTHVSVRTNDMSSTPPSNVISPSQPQWASAPQPIQYPLSATWATDNPTALKPHSSPSNLAPRFVSKPPKSRACEACRKSKRRCTHNPYSESSLLPVRESLVHRISSAAKRSSETSNGDDDSVKRVKRETDTNGADIPQIVALDAESRLENQSNGVDIAVIDPSLSRHDENGFAGHPADGVYVIPPVSSDSSAASSSALNGVSAHVSEVHDTRALSTSHTDPSNSRSRTSSIHLQATTSGSEGINGSHSPPTSPLTDIAPSSPNQPHSTALVTPTERTPEQIVHSDENKHTPRPRNPAERCQDTSTTPTFKRRKLSSASNSVNRRTSTPFSGVAGGMINGIATPSTAQKTSAGSRRGSTVGSPVHDAAWYASPGPQATNRSPSTAAPKTQKEIEEEESVKLAKMLAAEDAGLRRRGGSGMRYTR